MSAISRPTPAARSAARSSPRSPAASGWCAAITTPTACSSCRGRRPPVESARFALPHPDGEVALYLSHYPHRSWPGVWRGSRHLYGHTHAKLPDTMRSCDVGVDAWDYRPVTLDEAVARQAAAPRPPEELVSRVPRLT